MSRANKAPKVRRCAASDCKRELTEKDRTRFCWDCACDYFEAERAVELLERFPDLAKRLAAVMQRHLAPPKA